MTFRKLSRKRNSRSKRGSFSWIRLLLFGSFAFVVMILAVFWITFGPTVMQLVYQPQWKKDVAQAVGLCPNDRKAASTAFDTAMKEAEKAGAQPWEKMSALRDYANALYNQFEFAAADKLIDKIVAMEPKEGFKKGSIENNVLAMALQDRAWDRHGRYLDANAIKKKELPDGVADQERAAQLAEFNFGADHLQTVHKKTTLACMLVESGSVAEGEKTFAAIAETIAKNASLAPECAWYLAALKARAEAFQGQFEQGLATCRKGFESTENEDNKDRIWTEFKLGLRVYANRHEKAKVAAFDERQSPLKGLEHVDKDFWAGNFKALDALEKVLLAEKRIEVNGVWTLCYFYDALAGEDTTAGARDLDEEDYKTRLAQFDKWLKENPSSAAARIGQAMTYYGYAWLARGSGYADTVTREGWRLYKERIAKGKAALDADPQIKKKDPSAFEAYATAALAQGVEKDQYLKMVDECHKAYPDFYQIDRSASYYLLPRWHGEDGDTARYIARRSDQLGGVEGDVLYARLVSHIMRYFDEPFGSEGNFDFARFTRGYKELIKKNPSDIQLKMDYLNSCRKKGDYDSMKLVFDALK